MKLRLAVCCVLLLSLLGCQQNPSMTVAVPQSVIQEGVDLYFPLSSDEYLEQDSPVVLTLTDATVLLEQGRDQIGLKFNLTMTQTASPPEMPTEAKAAAGALPRPGFPKPDASTSPGVGLLPLPSENSLTQQAENLKGSVTVWGDIAYRPQESAFYCYSPTFEQIQLEGLPDRLRTPALEAVERLLSQYLNENSIYTLSDSNTKTAAAKLVLKSLTVKDGTLYVELGI